MKDPFKHADKTFVVGENRSYIAELPHHLAHKRLPNDVARTELFKLDSREGNILTFKHGKKVLTLFYGNRRYRQRRLRYGAAFFFFL